LVYFKALPPKGEEKQLENGLETGSQAEMSSRSHKRRETQQTHWIPKGLRGTGYSVMK